MPSKYFVLFVFLFAVYFPYAQSQSTFLSFAQVQAILNRQMALKDLENFRKIPDARRFIDAPEYCMPPKVLDRLGRCRDVWG